MAGGGVCDLYFVGGMTGSLPLRWRAVCSFVTRFCFDFGSFYISVYNFLPTVQD